MIDLSLSQARRVALAAQFPTLEGETPTARALQAIGHLGYVQIDTIHVVQRAHHHTLWSRDHTYEPDALHQLLATDRAVFEYWGHAASYLPMTDYRYYLPLMRNFIQQKSWYKHNLRLCKDTMPLVLRRIREEGPQGSKDFENPNPRRGKWWDWKPAKMALELLMWTGELMVSRRDGFNRVYDLTERVLPAHIDTTEPDQDELGRFCVRRALQAHTLASAKSIAEHLGIADRKQLRSLPTKMVITGELEKVRVESVNETYYALPGTLNDEPAPQPARLLSPFDNACIHRKRLESLFNYEYTIECYVPAPKRKWGYFSLPLLLGERFVGRVDAKADRQSGTLLLRAVHFEADLAPSEELVRQIAPELHAFRRFNGCESWQLESVTRGWKQLLARALRDAADA